MGLLGKKELWRGSTQKWGAATEGRVVAPNLGNVQGSHPAFRVTQITKRLWPGVLRSPRSQHRLCHLGVTCASLAVYCPLPRPPACFLPGLPYKVAPKYLTPPSVLLPSCPSQHPCRLPTPHALSSRGKKGERTGTESGAATDGCWCGAGMRDGGFRHSGTIRPSCRMSASIAASALMLWAGERQKPRCTSVPSAGILSPESRGSSGRGAYQAGQRTAPQEKLGMQARVGTGPARSSCCPAPVGTLIPKDASHQMTQELE